MPPDKRSGPRLASATRSNVSSPAKGLDVDRLHAGAVKCAYLHPRHLTGCRQLALPGSKYCIKHLGADAA